MGFRFKRFDYVGGVSPMTTDYVSDGSSANVLAVNARCEAICKDFADFIISCGKGWSLDTARNATTSDFVQIPVWDQSHTVYSDRTAPALFFVNANGAKLFLCMNCFNGNTGLALDEQHLAVDMPTLGVGSTYKYIVGGICMSIIPAGSTNNFGSTFNSSFLPSDATLIRGTHNLFVETTKWQSYIERPYSSYTYSYGVFVDSECVGIGGNYSTTTTPETLRPGYFVGKVIGTLAHEESTLQKQYGSFALAESYTNDNYPSEFNLKTLTTETGITRYGIPFVSSLDLTHSTNTNLSIFKADGTSITGWNSVNIRVYADVYQLLYTNQVINPTISGATRWFPFMAAVCTSDLANDGIVPGDGFKGYLDTDLFRCAQCNLNQLYANGTFCGWNNMLMIGWDATNTDSL